MNLRSVLSRRPTLPTAIALLALAVASTGTAVAATGQLVNIADGSNAARLAKVDVAGKLAVGDGAGPLTVDGAVSETAPANLVRVFGFPSSSCPTNYTVPAGKALIIKSITFFAHSTSPGSDSEIDVYSGAGCGSFIAAGVTDRTDETIAESFGAGMALPAGSVISSYAYNSAGSYALQGYLVPAAAVPAGAAGAPQSRPQGGGPVTTRSTSPH
jgi:hypothetical protein